jgi:hypothetical protein
MIKNFKNQALAVLLLSVAACSSSSSLRRFDNDLSQDMPIEVAKKFEVKEIGAATPTPSPAPTKKAHRKKKETKVTIEPAAPPMRRVDPLPFAVGEKLKYGIRYIGLTAAYFDVEILPFKTVNDRKVFHLQGNSTRFTMDLDETKQ